jgi:hypothetical protein
MKSNVAEFPPVNEEEKKALLLTPLHTDELRPQTLGQALEWARIMCVSNLVPEGMRGNPADVLIAILWGNQLGMSVVQALQNIAVVNGRATIWGDAFLAIVMGRAGAELEKFEEKWEPDVEAGKWTTTVKRKGREEVVRSFSIADAKKITYYAAGNKKILAEKDTYQNYPRRMCKFKARNEALRDTFPDLLLGIGVREEADEYEDPRPVGRGATAAASGAGETLAELFAIYDEDTANAIGKGFDELSMSTAERRVKLREFGDNSAGLLEWLKSEYTLRRTRGAQRTPTPRKKELEKTTAVNQTPAPAPAVQDDDAATSEGQAKVETTPDAGAAVALPKAGDLGGVIF